MEKFEDDHGAPLPRDDHDGHNYDNDIVQLAKPIDEKEQKIIDLSDEVHKLKYRVELLQAMIDKKQEVIYEQAGRINEMMFIPGVTACLDRHWRKGSGRKEVGFWAWLCFASCRVLRFFKIDLTGKCQKDK